MVKTFHHDSIFVGWHHLGFKLKLTIKSFAFWANKINIIELDRWFLFICFDILLQKHLSCSVNLSINVFWICVLKIWLEICPWLDIVRFISTFFLSVIVIFVDSNIFNFSPNFKKVYGHLCILSMNDFLVINQFIEILISFYVSTEPIKIIWLSYSVSRINVYDLGHSLSHALLQSVNSSRCLYFKLVVENDIFFILDHLNDGWSYFIIDDWEVKHALFH